MNNFRLQKRLQQVKKALSSPGSRPATETAALLISSALSCPSSRDQAHPFRQNSDFLYLTGAEAQDLAIFVSSELPAPLLFGSSMSKEKALWEGPGINLSSLASNIGADFVECSNLDAEINKRLQGISTFYYSGEPGSVGMRIARRLLETPSHQRGRLPNTLRHSDVIIEPLRLLKDPDEVKAIYEANKVTNAALLCSLPFIRAGKSESSVAATIDYSFRLQGAKPGFASIVAAGKNAATLHHSPSNYKLKKGQMLLFDVGACLGHYNADISRVVCVDSRFSGAHRDIYEVVLSAQKAALKKVRHGVLSGVLYEAAVRELSIGLKELKVLKGSVSTIIDKKLYLPFFPHGIGHTLGLDVHDVGNLRANLGVKLQKGMVITVEPGLYFQKATKHFSACGVRIEDNVLVTDSGCEILSEGFPKKISEIEDLMA